MPLTIITFIAFVAVAILIFYCVMKIASLPQVKNEEQSNPLGNLKTVGCITKFGQYEWRVLDIKDSNMLLISRYAIAGKKYNEEKADVTWENCTIRHWLNDGFFNEFDEAERMKITTTTVVNHDNPEYGTKGGNNTEDKVFLLSLEEMDRYFSSDTNTQYGDVIYPDRLAAPDDIAVLDGVYVSKYLVDGKGACNYWLRSPGAQSSTATAVDYDGFVGKNGCSVDSKAIGVRPAMWVQCEDNDI